MAKRRKKVIKWFPEKTVHMGWEKDMSIKERRELALDAHGGDYLSTARSLQALANVTRDKKTRRKAGADAKYFYGMHRKCK